MKKVKSVNYGILNVTNYHNGDLIGLKNNDTIDYLKNSEVPIMDIVSNGSQISKNGYEEVFIKANLEEEKKEKEVNDVKEVKEEKKEIKIKEMTIDDFLTDFKL